jgi:hypothetical protein
VVVAVGSRFGKERGDGGKVGVVEAGRHHGRRCRAKVSSQRWVKRMASASLWSSSWRTTARGRAQVEGTVWAREDVDAEAG